MRALVLRFDAPIMSFGGVKIDRHAVTWRFPGQSMITGLVANALGYDHRDTDSLRMLQERVEYAARWDVSPERLVDYHTVSMGQPKMREPGWTTRGVSEHRTAGDKFGTNVRLCHYWVDGLMTVVMSLADEDRAPTLEDVLEALRHPARPLFLGRKACLPARPLVDPKKPVVEGGDLKAILRKVPLWDRNGNQVSGFDFEACWPAQIGFEDREQGEIRQVHDLRDWVNRVHRGGRLRAEGVIEGG